MSWVTIIWSMTAAACLTLALMHGYIWCRQREAWANLLFAVMAVATAALAGCELAMMRAATPAAFGTALRWLHLPAWVVILSLAGFVRLYLNAGRTWLFWSICGLRTLSLILNFLLGQNLNYWEITRLQPVHFLGETVSVAGQGVPNHWMLVGQTTYLLLLVFVVDATLTAWRRSDRRRALVVGGSVIFFVIAATGEATAVLWQAVRWPITASLPALGTVAAMAYELTRDALRAAQLVRELQASETRVSLATKAAGLRLWEWDMVRDEILATDRTQTHSSPAQFERRGFNQFLQSVHADDREPVSHAVAKSMNGDGELEAEYRVVLPNGATRWMVSRGRVEFNGVGKPVRMRGVSLDITRHKEAEEALRESEARFRILADTAPVLIWMSGPDRLCTFFNKGWLDFTGRTLEQELGNGWTKGVHEKDFDHCLEVYVNAFDARREFMMEYRLRRHDSEYRWVLDQGVPRFAPDGAFLGYIGSCIDISEHKQSELEIAQQRNELAHIARVSTMGELAASLAHELNQPLGAILSNAEAAELFLQQDPPPLHEVREILAEIRKDDQRAGDIIRRMHTLLRKHELALVPLNLNELVQDTLKLVSADAALRKTAIRADLVPDPPPLLGDRVHLQQVLLNLILNAMEAMAPQPAERRKLVVRTACNQAGEVEMAVIDSGPGIAPDNLHRLFEAFYTTKPKGMGMGLSIARRIVKTHGGRLWAENNTDGGATFRFTLPAAPIPQKT
jgi:two-component system, LuxR family, sensor kinase FixL